MRNKRGHFISEEIITWIIWIGLAVAAGAAIYMVVNKFA